MPNPAPATLVKTRFVVDLLHEDFEECVTFGSEHDPDDPNRHRIITLDSKVWDELGRPNQITITLEPGDLLNG